MYLDHSSHSLYRNTQDTKNGCTAVFCILCAQRREGVTLCTSYYLLEASFADVF